MSHSSDSKGNGESSTSANTLASARSDDAPANQADLQAALKARLIASGEYERFAIMPDKGDHVATLELTSTGLSFEN
jgi:hypothetical protein